MAHEFAKCNTSMRFCDFKVLLMNDEVQKEVCRFCNRIVLYKKIDGRVDNVVYMRDHIRAFAQPGTRIFEEINGRKKAREFEYMAGEEARVKKRNEDRSHEFKKMIEDGKRTIFT